MLYRVDYKKGKWFVGGAECPEDEAKEFIAMRFTPMNMERASNIMKSIKKNAEKK